MTAYPFLPAWQRRNKSLQSLVFALPHAGGGAVEYRRLAPELRPAVDLQPLQLPGREELSSIPPVSDMQELVTLLGTAILTTGESSFGLFGHSLGAAVAAELVSWLTSKGRPPSMLIVSARGWRPADTLPDPGLVELGTSDDQLIQRLLGLGGTEPDLFRNPELRAITLKTIRSDLSLARTYRPTFSSLDCPILALGGTVDPEVSEQDLAAWQSATTARFEMQLIAGDHFYFRGQMALVGKAISEFKQGIAAAPAAQPAEPALAERFLAILRAHLDDDEFILTDDFYAAGGDSLVALAVVADAKEHGIEVSLRDLLTSTIMAEVPITSADPAGSEQVAIDDPLVSAVDTALAPAGVESMYPASALQQGLIYLCELADDPSLYHDLIACTINQPVDRSALRSALDWLGRRHPAMRTSFDLSNYSVPMALVAAEAAIPVEFVEVGSSEMMEAALHDWRTTELSHYLDWDRAPLMRCAALDQRDEFTLCLAVHHAVIDGWSLARLVIDLLLAYDSFIDKAEPPGLPMPPTAIQSEFVAAERAQSTDPAARAFWTELLSGTNNLLPATTQLPKASDRIVTQLDQATCDDLRAAAVAAGVPLKSVCLAAHWAALVRWSGREADIVTGVISNGRPETIGADQVVGLFLNTVPLRIRDATALEELTTDGWQRLARSAMRAEHEISPYRRYPFAELDRIGRGARLEATFNFTRFRTYKELSALRQTTVKNWWSWDEASFPLMADFMFDSPDYGSAHLLSFDPDQVPPEEASRFAECTRTGIRELIAALTPAQR